MPTPWTSVQRNQEYRRRNGYVPPPPPESNEGGLFPILVIALVAIALMVYFKPRRETKPNKLLDLPAVANGVRDTSG